MQTQRVPRTVRQRRGTAAEDVAAAHLEAAGWRVLARNVRLGRDEIDIVALDPGPPPLLVCVEVRSARSTLFGAPEERVDEAKVRHLYRAAAALRARARLPDGRSLPTLPLRVDLVVVDDRGSSAGPQVRRLAGVSPR